MFRRFGRQVLAPTFTATLAYRMPNVAGRAIPSEEK
jgi:hypothetical protein